MILPIGETRGNAIAVFPFLKTIGPIQLGQFTFRSTDDTADLCEDDASHVQEIADMLFLQDERRIRSSSYAILPPTDLDQQSSWLDELEHVQAIVAYCYSAPHPTSGTPFFSSEQASIAIFSPEPVPIFLVRPDHHVISTDREQKLETDQRHRVPGFEGRYNFRQPFWTARGSRLYPPVPHLPLNIGQDLFTDLEADFVQAPKHHLLPSLLRQPTSETSSRVLTAIAWYNRANSALSDELTAVMHLAVAFETLLGLPRDDKTDRFVDAVSLLLGRVPRLDEWARQFYGARSDVVHGGRSERLRFAIGNQKTSAHLYQSLLTYGRQVFRLCVGALQFGAFLAEREGLRHKFVTNQERFEFICKELSDEQRSPEQRLCAIEETVTLIETFRFVGQTGLLIETMIGAVRSAAKVLTRCTQELEPIFLQGLTDLGKAPHSRDWYEALSALEVLASLKGVSVGDQSSPQSTVWRLVNVVWHCTFMHYFWLGEQKNKSVVTKQQD